MTQADQATTVSGHLLTPAEYAMLGAQMSQQAGWTQEQIAAFFEEMNRAVLDAAARAARDCVMKLVPATLKMTNDIHNATALEIMRRIQARQAGFGVLSHAACAQICMDVAQEAPRTRPRGPVRAGNVLQPQVNR